MELKSIKVENTQDGRLLTVSYLLGVNEKLEQDDMPKALDALREIGIVGRPATAEELTERASLRRRSTDKPAEAPVPLEETGGTASGRRRRSVPSSSASADGTGAASDTAPSTPEPSPTSAGEAATSTGRRRRTSAAAAETQPHTSAASATTASPSEITDRDLVKAASQASGKVGPDTVMGFLQAGFSVKNVSEIPQHMRQLFLDGLKDIGA